MEITKIKKIKIKKLKKKRKNYSERNPIKLHGP